MPFSNPQFDRYRLVLVAPDSKRLFVEEVGGEHFLPRISIPRWTRTAEKVTSLIRGRWGFHAIVLDVLGQIPGAGNIVIAERLDETASLDLPSSCRWSVIDTLREVEINLEEHAILSRLLEEGATGRGPFSRFGWIREMVTWAEDLLKGEAPLDLEEIHQLNASGEASLIRIARQDGRNYWFKAAAGVGSHEGRITATLARFFPEYLPEVVGVHPRWNAWLMRDGGVPLSPEYSGRRDLAADVIRRLAELQITTTPFVDTLLVEGCHDHRMPVLRAEIPDLIPYLEEAMRSQDEYFGPRIERTRLRHLATLIEEASLRLEENGIPDALMHCDISLQNILVNNGGCVFTDWAQASIGNPFVTFEQLCVQYAQIHQTRSVVTRLRRTYQNVWREVLPGCDFQRAFTFVPLVALASSLCCRREWLTTEGPHRPQSQSYARILARQMDHAAHLIEENAEVYA